MLRDRLPNEVEIESARDLVKRLECNPAAIDAAATYIRMNGSRLIAGHGEPSTVGSYLKAFDIAASIGLQGAPSSIRNVAYLPWSLAIQTLTRSGVGLVREVEFSLAVLGECSVPASALEHLINGGLAGGLGISLVELEDALQAAVGYGMVSISGQGAASVVRLTDLVRIAALWELEESGKMSDWEEASFASLRRAISSFSLESPSDWALTAMFANAVNAAIMRVASGDRDPSVQGDLLESATRVAVAKYLMGEYVEGREIANSALRVLDGAVSTSARFRGRLVAANCLRERGDVPAALREYSALRGALTGVSPADEIELELADLRARREVGAARYVEAPLRRLSTRSRSELGETHKLTCWVTLNLGRCLRDQGRHEEASVCYEEVERWWGRENVPDDLTSLDIQFEIAENLRESGSAARSLEIFRQIIPLLESVYGSSHANALITKLGCAMALRECDELLLSREMAADISEAIRFTFGENSRYAKSAAALSA